MVIETDHREEYRNETRMDASSTLAGSTFRGAERPVEEANDASLLRRVAPGPPIFFVAIAKSGKAKDCKSFILGSNPSGDSGAVV